MCAMFLTRQGKFQLLQNDKHNYIIIFDKTVITRVKILLLYYSTLDQLLNQMCAIKLRSCLSYYENDNLQNNGDSDDIKILRLYVKSAYVYCLVYYRTSYGRK